MFTKSIRAGIVFPARCAPMIGAYCAGSKKMKNVCKKVFAK
jgi:hypothetical protein